MEIMQDVAVLVASIYLHCQIFATISCRFREASNRVKIGFHQAVKSPLKAGSYSTIQLRQINVPAVILANSSSPIVHEVNLRVCPGPSSIFCLFETRFDRAALGRPEDLSV